MKGTFLLVIFMFPVCGAFSRFAEGFKRPDPGRPDGQDTKDKGRWIKRGGLSGFSPPSRGQGRQFAFSDQEEVMISVSGEEDRSFKMKKVDGGKENRKLSKGKSEQTGVYTSEDMDAICREDCDETSDCETHCSIKYENETCFISSKMGNVMCTPSDPNAKLDYRIPEDKGEEPETGPGTGPQTNETERHRRSLVPDLSKVGIVKIIFFYDVAFMEIFQAMVGGNADDAITEATIFTKLVVNEMTISYQSLNDFGLSYTLGAVTRDLNLAVYVADIEFPDVVNNQFQPVVWTVPASGNSLDDLLDAFRDYVMSSSFTTSKNYDHLAAMTGTDYAGNTIGEFMKIGIAYFETSCRISSKTEGYLTSANKNFGAMARLLAHELGHNLGAGHDGEDNSCAGDLNIMAPAIVYPDSSTKDTYYKFSSCSANDFKNHLSSIPEGDLDTTCLVDSTLSEEDFLTNFCLGFRGEAFTLEGLCIAAYGTTSSLCSTSTALSNNQYVSNCLPHNGLACTIFDGRCALLGDIPSGTKCSTDNNLGDKVCHFGECQSPQEICTTTTATATTTTSTDTPDTTTTTTTTTDTPETTTTTTTTDTADTTTTTTTTDTPDTTTSTTTTTTTATTTTPANSANCPCISGKCCKTSPEGTCRGGCFINRRGICKLESPALVPDGVCTCIENKCCKTRLPSSCGSGCEQVGRRDRTRCKLKP